MQPGEDPMVKYFIAVLYADDVALERALAGCEAAFGDIDFQSEPFPFQVTDYYEKEMGQNLNRLFVSFEELASAGNLAIYKDATNTVEDKLARNGNRTVNLDIGYLDFDKVVLASAKPNWQKIYLRDGFFADLTLHYSKGEWHPFDWSFPDFKQSTYYSVFHEIRNRFKRQTKLTG